MKTVLDNKKFAIITDRGYIYSPDKTKKTLNVEEAAKWYGCEKEDLVRCYGSAYRYSGFLIEPDDSGEGLKRVKVSYWRINNSRPKDTNELTVELCDRKADPEKSFYYIYADGSVQGDDSRNDATRIKNAGIHRTKTLPIPSKDWWYDYAQNMCDMNNETVCYSCDALCKKTKEILKDAGFPEKLRFKTGYECEINTFDRLITYCKMPRGSVNNKEVESIDGTLSDFGDSKLKIEKTSKGILFRIHSDESRCDGENARVFISNKGTVSQLFKDRITNADGKEVESWTASSTRSTRWFYEKLYENQPDKEIVKDLVLENPKFKYINDWINEHIEDLLCLKAKAEWETCGIIEFLRLANKYPVFVDAMIKFGYGDELFLEEKTFEINEEGFRCYYGDRGKKVTVKNFAKYRFEEGTIFGELNKVSDFFGCLGINRGQWKYLLANAKDDSIKSKIEALRCIDSMKQYFCGIGVYYYRGERPEYMYKSVAEVPMNEFARYFALWKEYAYNHRRGYYRSESGFDGDSLKSTLNGWSRYGRADLAVLGNINADEKFKTVEECVKRGFDYNELSDYSSLRERCVGIEGYNIEDWPLVPKTREEIVLFHDRLVDIYNEAQNLRREKEEAGRQKMYEKRLPKIRKFNYEEDADSRCVVCPEKLMEIVSEGQRLSHCVATYTDSVAEGRETILFLRNKLTKGQSYATIDIEYVKPLNTWKVRQIHTKCNGDISADDVAFLKRWAVKNNVDPETVKVHYGALGHL